MRLSEFISRQEKLEDPYLEKLEDDIYDKSSWNYLKVIKKIKKTLYRGSDRKIDYFEEIIRSTTFGRIPMAMPEIAHNILNREFKRKFGWEVRNGIYTIGDLDKASDFGEPYIFIPSNKTFRFVWSDKINDLNIWLQKEYPKFHWNLYDIDNEEDIPVTYMELLESIPNFYSDRNLDKAILSGNEVIFDCDRFLLVNMGYMDLVV